MALKELLKSFFVTFNVARYQGTVVYEHFFHVTENN